jgi:hypothetical protein
MAASLTVLATTSNSVIFQFSGVSGESLSFQRSGAAAPSLDLVVLATGPLKEYLSRLANWSLANLRARIQMMGSFGLDGNLAGCTPLPNPTNTNGIVIAQNGQQSVQFLCSGGAAAPSLQIVEWVFRHSAGR